MKVCARNYIWAAIAHVFSVKPQLRIWLIRNVIGPSQSFCQTISSTHSEFRKAQFLSRCDIQCCDFHFTLMFPSEIGLHLLVFSCFCKELLKESFDKCFTLNHFGNSQLYGPVLCVKQDSSVCVHIEILVIGTLPEL